MRRYPSSSFGHYTYSFGPGPLTPAVKVLLIANVAIFILSKIAPTLTVLFGLSPASVFGDLWVWQPATYMFFHGDLFHILFNMLIVWMFGVDLERRWGTGFFTKFYFVTGIGAAITTIVVSLLPFGFAERIYYAVTIGASGAGYGLLMAYALYYPERPILLIIFPVPARVFVFIAGAIALLSSIGQAGGVAHVTHLGGLLFGYLYLTTGRGGLVAEIKYRYLKWKMNRLRRKFDVYSGGRRGNGQIH